MTPARSDALLSAAIQRRLAQLSPDDQATIDQCATEMAERYRARGLPFGKGAALEILYSIGRTMHRLERRERGLL